VPYAALRSSSGKGFTRNTENATFLIEIGQGNDDRFGAREGKGVE